MLQQENTLKNLNESNFDMSVAKGVTLVDFWAPWCQPCLMQAPVLDEVARVLSEKAAVAKVNVDDSPVLAERFMVQGIPTLIVFKNGNVIKRLVGVQTRQTLLDTIKDVYENSK